MADVSRMGEVAAKYKGLSVAVLGSHSALDVCQGAKSEGLPTIVLCEKGREKTYSQYYKYDAKSKLGVVDEAIVLNKFADCAGEAVTKKLREKSAIFIPHRSFCVYVGYDAIEKEFEVPIFGNRKLLRAEERTAEKNQYYLLKQVGIRMPKQFSSPSQIDRLCLVKASEAKRSYERAFFFASNADEWKSKGEELIAKGVITREGLKSAVIEEFCLGAQYNFNFFYSPVDERLELMGTDMRRQTNLDGVLRLPAPQQIDVLKQLRVNNIEIGHVACTIKESMLEKVFEAGEKFVEACRKEYAPGIIGPFALQGAVVPAEKGEEIVVFDVSFRVPGSPGTRFTPYTEYLHGKSISVGKRIAMELKKAKAKKMLGKVVT
ncbi:5-formaminoimidazole-4-carboxamide-1-(beta)-D-ribofuranosyl 5'-monophosphate synthetase [Candidatus Gugararchaeum adminiculabundum]|nr:5-formaminoimidazole-4-carboxamide-1-(beta)-D-ribofuranosyl 5'-monophosphate synthetase [Candidatus Gugararchaeum adminiculabundum]